MKWSINACIGALGLSSACAVQSLSYPPQLSYQYPPNGRGFILLPNGYTADRFARSTLDTLAGIVAETVTVRTWKEGDVFRALFDGTYSYLRHPNAMDTVCRYADGNGDRYISREEAHDLNRRFREKLRERTNNNK